MLRSADASSEHMSTMDTTDSEDSPRPPVQQGAQASQLAVVGGSYSNLSPMIIMNNVLLKQVRGCHTRADCQRVVDQDAAGLISVGVNATACFSVSVC